MDRSVLQRRHLHSADFWPLPDHCSEEHDLRLQGKIHSLHSFHFGLYFGDFSVCKLCNKIQRFILLMALISRGWDTAGFQLLSCIEKVV